MHKEGSAVEHYLSMIAAGNVGRLSHDQFVKATMGLELMKREFDYLCNAFGDFPHTVLDEFAPVTRSSDLIPHEACNLYESHVGLAEFLDRLKRLRSLRASSFPYCVFMLNRGLRSKQSQMQVSRNFGSLCLDILSTEKIAEFHLAPCAESSRLRNRVLSPAGPSSKEAGDLYRTVFPLASLDLRVNEDDSAAKMQKMSLEVHGPKSSDVVRVSPQRAGKAGLTTQAKVTLLVIN